MDLRRIEAALKVLNAVSNTLDEVIGGSNLPNVIEELETELEEAQEASDKRIAACTANHASLRSCYLVENPQHSDDSIMWREDFSNYMDNCHSNGELTSYDVDTMENPY